MNRKSAPIFMLVSVSLVWTCAFSQSGRIYNYRISQVDSDSSFGFESYDDSPQTGPTSVLLNGQFAFVVDQYHSNIKKIDVYTGDIVKTSQNLNPNDHSRRWFRDIALFHDEIYVTSDLESVYVFTKNLAHIRSHYIPTNFEKYIISVTDDYLELTGLWRIARDKRVYRIPLNPDLSMPTHTPRRSFSFSPLEGRYLIQTDRGNFVSDYPVPNLEWNAEPSNLDFDQRTFVFFGVDSARFQLIVLRK